MKWIAIARMIMELIRQLQQKEASLNAQGETLGINWEQLLKYLPEILDLIFKIIQDQNITGPGPAPMGDVPPPTEVDFADEKVCGEFQAMVQGVDANDFRSIIEKLLPLIIQYLPILIELIGKKK